METRNFYIQYHNADNLGHYPYDVADFNKAITQLTLDNSVRNTSWINTRKKLVEKSMGDFCFLIVGKTEDRIKNYYLWSFFRIKNWELDDYGFYDVFGSGFNFEKPALLNKLSEFESFKEFCGRFEIGFQLINKHPFLKILHTLAKEEMSKLKVIFPPFYKSLPAFKDKKKYEKSETKDLKFLLTQLNDKMQLVSPEKRSLEIETILRKDKEIVATLKKIANYKCQFPKCNAVIPTKGGENYVEVAHIKPVKNGGKSIIGNLLVLCPNHHKEFDHGDLEINEQTEEKISGTLNGKDFSIQLLT